MTNRRKQENTKKRIDKYLTSAYNREILLDNKWTHCHFPLVDFTVVWAFKTTIKMNTKLSTENLRHLSDVSLVAGVISIVISIATWFSKKDQDRAHAERFGIFIGLWVPSLLILSNRLSRLAEEQELQLSRQNEGA